MYLRKVLVPKNGVDFRDGDNRHIRSERIGLDFGVLFRGAGYGLPGCRHRHHFDLECLDISESRKIC
jgi:hypothetical protein